MDSLPVIPIDPDYQLAAASVDACHAQAVEQPPTEHQVLFAQHLLATARRLPPGHPLCMTAGELLRLMGERPSEKIIRPEAKARAKEAERTPAPPIVSAGLCRRRLRKGEPRRRIETFLAQCDGPQTAQAIAIGSAVGIGTVRNELEKGPFERDAVNRSLWRIRRVSPAPLDHRS